MPPFKDKWWSELPQKAKDAATTLGWEQSTWDDDEFDKVPYFATPLSQVSEKKKAAAFYLGWQPIYSKPFCEDLWWQDVEEETKSAAAKIGFDQNKWDDGMCHTFFFPDLMDFHVMPFVSSWDCL